MKNWSILGIIGVLVLNGFASEAIARPGGQVEVDAGATYTVSTPLTCPEGTDLCIFAFSGATINNNGGINAYYSGIYGEDDITVNNNAPLVSDQVDFSYRTGIHVLADSTIVNNSTIRSEFGNAIIVSEGSSVTNNGTISAYFDGITSGSGGGKYDLRGPEGYSNYIEVTNNGDIISDQYFGKGFPSLNTGISVGDFSTVTNNGSITSVSGTGIRVGNNSAVINNDLIDAYYDGIVAGSNNTIENNAGAFIISDQHFPFPNASGIHAEDNNLITNAGRITSISSDGIHVGANNRITNSGTISAFDVGIEVFDYDGYEVLGQEFNKGDIYYDTDTVNVVTNTAEGRISGSIGILMNGPGIISTAGTITGSRGPAIALDYFSEGYDQFVTLESGAVVNGDIYDDWFDSDWDQLTLDGSGTFRDGIYGIEYIRKTGEGTWILDDESYVETYDTDILAGTLQVDGEYYYAGDFNIYKGATLAGNGDFGGYFDTMWNDGTIAPGPVNCSGYECIGEMNIYDSFENYRETEPGVFSAGNLAIDLYDDMSDHIYIDYEAAFGWKAADTDPGTITVTPRGVLTDIEYYFLFSWDGIYINGEYGADIDDFEPEVLAAMLVEDTALYNFTLRADDYEMWLEVEELSVIEAGGSEMNQMVYDYLADQEEQEALDALAGMNLGELTSALGPLLPEQYPNLLDISMGGFGIYRNAVTGRLGNLHLTHAPQQAQKYATSTVYAEGPSQARIPAFENQAQGWSSWGRILGMTGEQDNDNGVQGYEFDTYGVSFGFDNKVNDTCAIGAGFGLTNSDVSFNGGQETDMDSYHVSLYGTHSNERYYIDAALLYAANDYDSTRRSLGFEARSSTDGKEWGLYLGGGYTLMETDSMYFMSTASIEFSQVDIDGFAESGTGPLYDVSGYDTDSTVTTLGFRWGGKMTTGTTRFEPELRLAWAHEFGDTDRQVNARFVGTTSTFAIEGVDPSENSILLGLGANFFVKDNVTLYADYDGEFRDGFDGHALSAGFRYNF